jgi:hypothetical protein
VSEPGVDRREGPSRPVAGTDSSFVMGEIVDRVDALRCRDRDVGVLVVADVGDLGRGDALAVDDVAEEASRTLVQADIGGRDDVIERDVGRFGLDESTEFGCIKVEVREGDLSRGAGSVEKLCDSGVSVRDAVLLGELKVEHPARDGFDIGGRRGGHGVGHAACKDRVEAVFVVEAHRDRLLADDLLAVLPEVEDRDRRAQVRLDLIEVREEKCTGDEELYFVGVAMPPEDGVPDVDGEQCVCHRGALRDQRPAYFHAA